MTFTTANSIWAATVYTVTVGSGAVDVCGIVLWNAPYSFAFTTVAVL